MQTIEEKKRDSPHPAIVADRQGIIIDVYSHFEQVFGRERSEITGQPLRRALPVYF